MSDPEWHSRWRARRGRCGRRGTWGWCCRSVFASRPRRWTSGSLAADPSWTRERRAWAPQKPSTKWPEKRPEFLPTTSLRTSRRHRFLSSDKKSLLGRQSTLKWSTLILATGSFLILKNLTNTRSYNNIFSLNLLQAFWLALSSWPFSTVRRSRVIWV